MAELFDLLEAPVPPGHRVLVTVEGIGEGVPDTVRGFLIEVDLVGP